MGRVGFPAGTRRYVFLLVRPRSGAVVDGATPRRGDQHASFLADFLGNCAIAFPICPLMRQKCAFRYFGPASNITSSPLGSTRDVTERDLDAAFFRNRENREQLCQKS